MHGNKDYSQNRHCVKTLSQPNTNHFIAHDTKYQISILPSTFLVIFLSLILIVALFLTIIDLMPILNNQTTNVVNQKTLIIFTYELFTKLYVAAPTYF